MTNPMPSFFSSLWFCCVFLLLFLLFLILCVRLKCAAIMWVSNYWFVAYRKRTAHFMHFGLVNAMASISKFTHNLQMDIRKQNVLITITCIGPKLSMNDPPTFALFPTNKRWRVCVCFLFSFSLRVLVGARFFSVWWFYVTKFRFVFLFDRFGCLFCPRFQLRKIFFICSTVYIFDSMHLTWSLSL